MIKAEKGHGFQKNALVIGRDVQDVAIASTVDIAILAKPLFARGGLRGAIALGEAMPAADDADEQDRQSTKRGGLPITITGIKEISHSKVRFLIALKTLLHL